MNFMAVDFHINLSKEMHDKRRVREKHPAHGPFGSRQRCGDEEDAAFGNGAATIYYSAAGESRQFSSAITLLATQLELDGVTSSKLSVGGL